MKSPDEKRARPGALALRSPRAFPLRMPLVEGAAATAAGAALFAATAAIERAAAMTPCAAALVEEGGKAILILGAGFAWRERGLSLGLVAAAVFAAVENLAYFLAFPEAGTLARLLWSLPVHLDAALLVALGALPLLGPIPRRAGLSAVRALAFPLALAAAGALHALANEAASGGISPLTLALGAIAGISLFAVLSACFLYSAYIGGFLHGTD